MLFAQAESSGIVRLRNTLFLVSGYFHNRTTLRLALRDNASMNRVASQIGVKTWKSLQFRTHGKLVTQIFECRCQPHRGMMCERLNKERRDSEDIVVLVSRNVTCVHRFSS